MRCLCAVLPGIYRKQPVFFPSPENAILVTGASSGIGKDAVLFFASRGYTVFASFRKLQDFESFLEDAKEYHALTLANIANIHPVVLDVRDQESIDHCLDFVSKQCQNLGVKLFALVNNAGVPSSQPSEFTDPLTIRNIIDTNVIGVINLTNRFLPTLRKNKGRVIVVGSLNGEVGLPFQSVYAASKFAVKGWCESLRIELRNEHVAVSLIKPGKIDTKIFSKLADSPVEPEAYMDLFKTYAMIKGDISKGGISPYYTSRAIYDAATSEYPKTSYLVGTDSFILTNVRRWIPDNVYDAMVLQALKFAGKKSN